jgi:hypothetical protein
MTMQPDLQSIAEQLDALSFTAHKSVACRVCGTLLSYFETQFWIYRDSEPREWNIKLPYCPVCEDGRVPKETQLPHFPQPSLADQAA